jgi:hypothetical protein
MCNWVNGSDPLGVVLEGEGVCAQLTGIKWAVRLVYPLGAASVGGILARLLGNVYLALRALCGWVGSYLAPGAVWVSGILPGPGWVGGWDLTWPGVGGWDLTWPSGCCVGGWDLLPELPIRDRLDFRQIAS